MSPNERELVDALRTLANAALGRDITMGDPCDLIHAKAVLYAAHKQALVVLAKYEKENTR